MENTNSLNESLNRLLARWGDKFIWRMQLIAQLISFVIASGGIFFILLNVDLSPAQIRYMVGGVLILVTIANILLLVIMRLISPNAHARLVRISKDDFSTTDEEEVSAWKEIVTFPWRFGIVAGIISVIEVTALTAFMYYAADVNASEAIHIAISGLLTITILISLVTLLLELLFVAPRIALVPVSLEAQLEGLSARSLNSRLQMLVATLILITILMIAPRGYQEAVNAMLAGGGNVTTEIPRIQFQLTLISVIALLFAVGYTALLAWSITRPIESLLKTMQSVQKGDLSGRAPITGTDDIGILAVYFNHMIDKLETFQAGLEKLAEERTIAVEIKSTQLKAAAVVAREAAALQDPDILLREVVRLISEKFGFYHVGIFLIDEAGEFAVLRATSSEGGKRMLERGHRLEVGRQGVVGLSAFQNRSHIAMDVGKDAVFFNNPDLPLTHSEAALPLSIGGKVIGVLDIQSTEIEAFRQDDIDLFATLADQVALAIQNARLINDSQTYIRQMESITGSVTQKAWQERSGQGKSVYRYTPAGLIPIEKGAGDQPEHDQANQLDIPIILRGRKIGTISLKRRETSPWLDSDETLAKEISDQVGLALENARLLDDAQQRANREQTISNLASTFGRYTDPDALLQAAICALHQLPNISEVSVVVSPSEKRSVSEGK